MSESIGVIVLAAGQGSRFRQLAGADKDKLLADCTGRDGAVRSVIEQVLVNLSANGGKRVLVTTADRPQVIRMAQARAIHQHHNAMQHRARAGTEGALAASASWRAASRSAVRRPSSSTGW